MKNLRKRLSKWLGILIFWVSLAYADSDGTQVKWGGYVDTYYAYSFNSPTGNSRNPLPLVLFTQATRNNELNVNLAFLEAKISANRVRGRIALQTGTSVTANYSSERNNLLGQMIQEAVAGYQLTERVWIDAGVYLSPIGLESWISRDNWTYTRSLMSDFSPYYHSGVRLSYELSDRWSAQINLVNGWQNITENNQNKAVIGHVSYTPSDSLNIIFNNFYGLETDNLPRFFNEAIVKLTLTDAWKIAGVVDLGLQKRTMGSSFGKWYQYTLLSQYQVTSKISLVFRFENYVDREGFIVQTQTPNGFQTKGTSLGMDIQLQKNLLFRNEIRGFWSKDSVFASQSGRSARDGLFVTALNLTF